MYNVYNLKDVIRKNNNKILFSTLLLFTNERDCDLREIIRLNLVREIGVGRNSEIGTLVLGKRKVKKALHLDGSDFIWVV